MRITNITDEGKRFVDEWLNDTAFITARTSGSTGEPKEIRLPKADMAVSARATNQRFGITAESRILCPLSAGYIAGKMMIVRALLSGCELIMEHPSNTPLAGDYGKIDLMAVVPSQCMELINSNVARNCLKNLIVGGAPLPVDLEDALTCMPWHTFATYGMTETCSHVALREIGSDVYTAMPGVSFETDSRGCLVINAPDYSFRQLVTNDVVESVSPHTFRWAGRFDNVINSGGIKFHPEQMEKLLEGKFPYPFFFRGAPHIKWGEAIEMVIECNDATADGIAAAAATACAAHLPRHAMPKRIVTVASLPRTANGKLKRRP